MRLVLIKIAGFVSIALSLLLISSLLIIPFIQGLDLVVGQSLKFIIYGVLLALSGIGLVLKNRKLFYSIFYLYPFLLLDLIFRIYKTLTMDRVGPDTDALNAAIERSIINTSVGLVVVLSVFLFFSYKDNLLIFKVQDRKMPLIHSFMGVLFFFVFILFAT